MHASLTTVALLAGAAAAAPRFSVSPSQVVHGERVYAKSASQNRLCFIIGDVTLPVETEQAAEALGKAPSDPSLQVDHLRDKVLSHAAGEDQELLDQVTELATQLQ
ncbi:hypothetical protein F5Y16DRAFT_404202 [Xylariaceae sp. FL0255]|nr:hypothetical protein F5Y16DRAFT_404202 [Xylariaceae sp. FL0255]